MSVEFDLLVRRNVIYRFQDRVTGYPHDLDSEHRHGDRSAENENEAGVPCAKDIQETLHPLRISAFRKGIVRSRTPIPKPGRRLVVRMNVS